MKKKPTKLQPPLQIHAARTKPAKSHRKISVPTLRSTQKRSGSKKKTLMLMSRKKSKPLKQKKLRMLLWNRDIVGMCIAATWTQEMLEKSSADKSLGRGQTATNLT